MTAPMTAVTASKDVSTDTIETAIEFVLALEHPCMSHIPYRDPDTIDPDGHMMMASTPLVARAPKAPQFSQSWRTSGAIIKELLNLSMSINLDGEITPVEAWQRLRDHPDFWRLSRSQVDKLKYELSTAVRCCGYVNASNRFLDTLVIITCSWRYPVTRHLLTRLDTDLAQSWTSVCSPTRYKEH